VAKGVKFLQIREHPGFFRIKPLLEQVDLRALLPPTPDETLPLPPADGRQETLRARVFTGCSQKRTSARMIDKVQPEYSLYEADIQIKYFSAKMQAISPDG
jgi:hypothetical protein